MRTLTFQVITNKEVGGDLESTQILHNIKVATIKRRLSKLSSMIEFHESENYTTSRAGKFSQCRSTIYIQKQTVKSTWDQVRKVVSELSPAYYSFKNIIPIKEIHTTPKVT